MNWLDEAINRALSIHILGAGLNSTRPAHQAIHDLDSRGWRLVPIHPRDAGKTILGRAIRREIEVANGHVRLVVLCNFNTC